MKNFAALGKVQVCIFCIFCILQANFVFAATYIAPAGDPALNIPEYLSETQEDGVQSVDGHCTCGDGKSDPVDTNKLWKDNCFAVDGKSYQAGQYLTSCSGCLKFICRLKVQNEKDPDCEKYGWEKLLEDTCCQDCNGKVFPAGSVMKEQKLTDKCATTVTTKCAFIRGGTTATIWESSSYEKCCINSEGVQLLNTTKLVPKLCSIRICASQSGKHEPSYALIKSAHGCDCCEYGGKLYADGTWKIIQGQNATCCEGRWVVELLAPPPECFHNDSKIPFHDLGLNHWGQDAKPVWEIEEGGRRLRETQNTRPSVGITDVGDTSRPVSFTGIVYSNNPDKDVLGMVFGYHNETNFYVVASSGTNKGPTNWYVGRLHATCGSLCATTTTISDAIWRPSLYPEDITILASGTDHWRHPDIYRFNICFNPTEHLIDVTIINQSNGNTDLNTGTIYDSTAPPEIEGGRIGVYVDSQANTVWDELNCADCKITMPILTK